MSREVATAFLIRQGCVIVACVIVRNSVKHLCKNLSKIASEKKCPWRESNQGPLWTKFYKASVLPLY